MRTRPALPVAVAAALFLGSTLESQTTRRLRPKIHKEARRLVTFLELPHKKADAANRLLVLGKVAVPDLARALSHPRADVVQTVAHILRFMGADAKAAEGALRRLAADKDKERAFVGQWALSKLNAKGTTLVADYSKGAIVEFDAAGKKIHEIKGIKSPWNAERLANGNYLVCLYTSKFVREIDRKGKVIWEYAKAQMPADAERLPNGNTLICDIGKKQVIEIDPKGKTVWSFKTAYPYDADRLANGNTLITDYTKRTVEEVDPKGKVVWTYKGASLNAERLPSGNTLIAMFTDRAVREVDPKGKTVFEFKVPFNPYHAIRLANGNTLVGGQKQVIEYDKKGKQIRAITVGLAASIERY